MKRAWHVLAALVLVTATLAVLSIQAVRREALFRKNLVVETHRSRITLDRPPLEWMHEALALPRVELLALTPAVAVKAAGLPATFPGDPADRLIVATALLDAAVLVTRDERIRRSGTAETVCCANTAER